MTRHESSYVRVRVQTKSKTETIKNVKGLWKVTVREKPEQGLANIRVRELLAHALNLPSNALRLVKGATSSAKTYLLITNKNHEDKL